MSVSRRRPEATSDHARSIMDGASVVAGATLGSRILGFARDVVIAFVLGAGPLADAFVIAFRMPNLLRRLFGEGSLTMTFVPIFASVRQEHGAEKAFAMARSCQVWLLLILGVASMLVLLFAEPLTGVLAPGLRNDPAMLDYTASLLRICFPYALFICSVALAMGVLNASNVFLGPALAPCVLNCILIAAGLTAHMAGWDPARSLAWAVLLAGPPQLALQVPFLKRIGFSWRGAWRLLDPHAARVGKLLPPTVAGSAAYQVNVLISTIFATLIAPGTVSYLYYAERVAQFPLGVFSLAVATAALPALSNLAGKGDYAGFDDALDIALRLSLFVCLPAAAGLAVLAQPIVDILFSRGAFGPDVAAATAKTLAAFSLGIPAAGVVRPLATAFYARQTTRAPALAAVACCCANVLFCIVLLPLAHVGLALAASLALWVDALVLLYFHLRADRPFPVTRQGTRSIVWFAVLSAAVALAAWAARMVTADHSGWSLLAIPVCAAGYFLLAGFIGLPEVKQLRIPLLHKPN